MKKTILISGVCMAMFAFATTGAFAEMSDSEKSPYIDYEMVEKSAEERAAASVRSAQMRAEVAEKQSARQAEIEEKRKTSTENMTKSRTAFNSMNK